MPSSEELGQNEALLENLKQIVLDNLQNEQFTVSSLSKQAGISRSHLHRKLKLLKGQSISQFIREVRLEEAMKMLVKDVGTSSEIAYKVGFSSSSYFHKCFLDFYGFTPGEAKKRQGEQKIDPGVYENKNQESDSSLADQMTSRKNFGIFLIFAVALALVFVLRSLNLFPVNQENISIAILPFEQQEDQLNEEYLSAGVHDALINELGKIPGFRVISKTSSVKYLDSNIQMSKIANELEVNWLLKGSVSLEDNNLKVKVRLLGAFPNEEIIWTKDYDQAFSQILFVQKDMVKNIIDKVKGKVPQPQANQLNQAKKVNTETYKNYLRGMYFLNKGDKAGFEKGIGFLQKAIELDPADPYAYAGMAVGYGIMGHGPVFEKNAPTLARASAKRALTLDENLDNAHTALGMVHLYQEWNWAAAESSFKEALLLNPNNEIAHAHYAWLHLLLDNYEEAIKEARLAVEIDPLSPTYTAWLAWIHVLLGHNEEAMIEVNKSLDLQKGFHYGHLVKGIIYVRRGEFVKAIAEHKKLPSTNNMYQISLAITYAIAGQTENALALFHDLEEKSNEQFVNPTIMGILCANLHEEDKAFYYLNMSLENKVYPLPWIKYFDGIELLENDPRLKELFQKLNLPLKLWASNSQ